MGLFQKRPEIGNSRPAYTLGMHKTILIIGLGNVGTPFAATRHNIGFNAVDAVADALNFGPWTLKKDLKAHITVQTIGETRVILCKPTTLMNLSGEAAQAIASFYKIPAQNIVAVYDELDIDFGNIRTRTGGGSAGHNGVKSLTQHLGEAYGRVRIGIGPKQPEQIDSSDYVLAAFSKQQQEQMKNLLQETTAIISEYIYSTQLPVETRNFLV